MASCELSFGEMKNILLLAVFVVAASAHAQGYRVLDIRGDSSSHRYAVRGNLHYYPAFQSISLPSAFYFRDQQRTARNELGVRYLYMNYGETNHPYVAWVSPDRKRFHFEGKGVQVKRAINRSGRAENMTITGRLVVDLYNDVNGSDRMVCRFTPDRSHPKAGFASSGLIFDVTMPRAPMTFRFRD